MIWQSLIAAMADLRDPATRVVWRHVRITLLDLLRLNDNTSNQVGDILSCEHEKLADIVLKYSDSFYLAAVITAISNAFTVGSAAQGMLSETEIESEQLLQKEATDVLDRAMTVDRLVPSYHNVVTKAGLEAQMKSILAGQRTNDSRELLSYTRSV